MEEYKCAFAAPLITGQFGCMHAQPVARRGGPDIACSVHDGHDRCAQLFERLKAVAAVPRERSVFGDGGMRARST